VNPDDRTPTICLTCSLGGHLEQIRKLRDVYEDFDHFFVVPDEESGTFPEESGPRRYTLPDINEGRGLRNPVALLRSFAQAWRILRAESPAVVISTGAGVTVPVILVAKALRIPTVFVESFARVTEPSRAGRVCYPFVDLFLVQHEELMLHYPRARFLGSLYEHL
jgi:hypothetical protein